MSSCVPAPQHDEIFRGLIHRVDASAGETGNKQTRRSASEILQTVQIDAKSVIYNHSYLPYVRFVNAAQAGKPAHLHTDVNIRRTMFSSWMTNKVLRLCSECLSADLKDLGIGYWRRLHQLPGVDVCEKHDAELIEVPEKAMKRPLTAEILRHRLPLQESSRHPLVSRFTALSRMTLLSSCTIHPARMAVVLSEKAQKMGIRFGRQQSGPRFSEVACESMPSAWTSRHFGERKPEKSMDGIFCSYVSPYRTASYLLAMTLLWDTAEEAVKACTDIADAKEENVSKSVGMRIINAVLAGASVHAACDQEQGQPADFESALRELLGSRPVNLRLRSFVRS